MPDTVRQPVKFERPPIVEVVCGVSFELPKPLTAAYVGLFWSKMRREYPNTLDQPPIPMTIEGATGSGGVEVQFVAMPPMRRTFFGSRDGRHLIQVQDDRFLLNWKRVEDADHYPSYANVIRKFHSQYGVFCSFLKDAQLGSPRVTQLELTYVNIIDLAPDAISPSSNVLVDHLPSGGDRFLPKAESINWQTSYALPSQSGRLHTVAQNARHAKSGAPVLRLDLTARGLPKSTASDSCSAWFDMAHDWITHGFADITSPEVQQTVWRRTS